MSNKRTMTIQKATDLGAALQELAADVLTDETASAFMVAVAQALAAGWEVVDVELTDDNVTISPHNGVMVAWMLPDYVADQLEIVGGETDLHVTLDFLGDAGALTLEQSRTLVGIVAEIVQDQPPLWGLAQDTDVFPATDDGLIPWFAKVNMPGLEELQGKITAALISADMPVSLKFTPYTPHITLAYLDADQQVPQLDLPPLMLTMDEVSVCIGGSRSALAFTEEPDGWWDEREKWMKEQLGDDYWDAITAGSAYRPFLKSVVEAEKRFTLGPWYIPDTVDSHDEWTDADELQASLWDYVDSGYRGIHLQHSPDIVAGRWVEIMTLPWAITIPIIDVNGLVVGHEYPAGTVMMGVIWEPWAWDLVLAGKITGYSIGGNAFRTDEQPPEAIVPDDEDDDEDTDAIVAPAIVV